MELRKYIAIVRHWLWLIVLGTILAGGSAYVISKLTTPVYRATTTLVINQASNYTPVTDYTSLITSQQIAKTYVELIKKTPTLEAVIKNLKLNKTNQQLLGMMSVTAVANTTLLTISVEDENAVNAQTISNEIARVFVNQVSDAQHARFGSSQDNLAEQMKQLQSDISATQNALVQARAANPPNQTEVARLESTVAQYQTSYSDLLKSYENLRSLEAQMADSLYVAEPADLPKSPVRPQTSTNTLLAAVVGAMLAVGVVFLIEYLDDTVKSPEDAEALGIVSIGNVGRISLKDATDKLVVAHDPRSPISEGFRSMRTNIQFASIDRPIRVLLVTSSGPGEGKSTVAANLATALAQSGQKVALIDADLRRPSVHREFGLTNSFGLTDVLLQGGKMLDHALQSTGIENLQVMVSGPVPPNPAELLGSERIAAVLDQLKTKVDWIILDTPPCMVVTDAAVLAKRADGVLVVARVGSTRRDALKEAVESLEHIGAKVLGVIMNQISAQRTSYYYNYYSRYYSNRYEYYYDNTTGVKEKRRRNGSELGQSLLEWLGRRHGSSPKRPVAVDAKRLAVGEPPNRGPE